mmetsp:Transcript_163831/g.525465  ORF Transcript_163831/g.525465 Transcript_163831/m.525465 type:complete len:222 (-) Transcript_163831:2141-2806(-)
MGVRICFVQPTPRRPLAKGTNKAKGLHFRGNNERAIGGMPFEHTWFGDIRYHIEANLPPSHILSPRVSLRGPHASLTAARGCRSSGKAKGCSRSLEVPSLDEGPTCASAYAHALTKSSGVAPWWDAKCATRSAPKLHAVCHFFAEPAGPARATFFGSPPPSTSGRRCTAPSAVAMRSSFARPVSESWGPCVSDLAPGTCTSPAGSQASECASRRVTLSSPS